MDSVQADVLSGDDEQTISSSEEQVEEEGLEEAGLLQSARDCRSYPVPA